MRELEEVHGLSIVEILREHHYTRDLTIEQMSDVLAVPAGTLANWLIRLGINRTALAREAAAEMRSA